MVPRVFHIRRGWVHLAVQLVLLALVVRLAVIQSLRHGGWRAFAERMERDVVKTARPRGGIVDRDGFGLAVTAPGLSMYVNPRAVPKDERQVVATGLARVLDLDAARVARALRRPGYFAWIKRDVSQKEALKAAQLDVPGAGFREGFQRRYPNRTFLCHVLGFVGTDGTGLGGVEARYEDVLAGRPGRRDVARDGLRRAMTPAWGTNDRGAEGQSVVLTIDSRVQRIAEEELAAACEEHTPEEAWAVVMDPRTGEVLALAGWPVFDPGRFGDVRKEVRRNGAVVSCLEPGSTFKPFVAAAAIEHGVVTARTVFNCHKGRYRMGRRVLHDAHAYDHLSVRDIIAYSSNIGIAQVAMRLGATRTYDALCAFGFGRPTGISLPGESSGILWHPSRWSGLSLASIAMGQEVAVTPLQLTAGFCVFANGGWYVRPRIVAGIAGRDGRILSRPETPAPRRVLSERVARLMCNDLLVAVVERGTARRSAIAGYRMGGKTGTAQIARRDGGGYEPGAYVAAFVGIVPAEAPRFVITVVAKRPGGKSDYGGVVAAPAVARMGERLLSSWRIPRVAAEAGAWGTTRQHF